MDDGQANFPARRARDSQFSGGSAPVMRAFASLGAHGGLTWFVSDWAFRGILHTLTWQRYRWCCSPGVARRAAAPRWGELGARPPEVVAAALTRASAAAVETTAAAARPTAAAVSRAAPEEAVPAQAGAALPRVARAEAERRETRAEPAAPRERRPVRAERPAWLAMAAEVQSVAPARAGAPPAAGPLAPPEQRSRVSRRSP